MEQSLLLVCLDRYFARKIAETICEETGKFYLDCEDLLAYELADREAIVKKCGIKYLKEQEIKFIKNLTDYSNTIMTMDYDLFMRDMHFVILNQNLKVYYLFLEYEDIKKNEQVNKLTKIAFIERDNDLKNNINNIINCNTKNLQKITSQIT